MKRLTIQTGARIHFGLLDTVAPFGGVGAMVTEPKTVIAVSPAERFGADAEIETRATSIAARFSRFIGMDELPRVRITADQLAPAHCGFGSGTQLSMAIAEGLCKLHQVDLSPELLAGIVAERGKRSAIGVHGYFVGGLIYESGECDHPEEHRLNHVQSRVELCPEWRVLLIRPRGKNAISGDEENKQFRQLPRPDQTSRSTLRQVLEEEILPAACAWDFDSFAESISRFNRASGMLFVAAQGGPFNGPAVTSRIEQLKELGVRGIGQSSWGPCVFAWQNSDEAAESLAQELEASDCETLIASPLDQGRQIAPEG